MKILKRFLRKVLEYTLEVIEHSLRHLPLSLLRVFQGVSLVAYISLQLILRVSIK